MIKRVVRSREGADPIAEFKIDGHFTVEDAFAHCERVAREHAENFPVASRFTPARLRPYVWALYAFARSANDFADEPRWDGRRGEALAYWEEQLERAFHGEAEHPVFVALRDTIERCDLPVTLLRDLLSAFTMDLAVTRYSTFAALEQYFTFSAHPVGRLVLHVFGHHDPSLWRFADDLGSALQLANVLQDIAVDLERDHIYLPEEDLRHFGVSEADLRAGQVTTPVRDLMRFQVARARALLERGRPLLERVSVELAFELSLIWHGGAAILDKIEAVDFDVFTQRPTLTDADKTRLLGRAAGARWPRFASSETR